MSQYKLRVGIHVALPIGLSYFNYLYQYMLHAIAVSSCI